MPGVAGGEIAPIPGLTALGRRPPRRLFGVLVAVVLAVASAPAEAQTREEAPPPPDVAPTAPSVATGAPEIPIEQIEEEATPERPDLAAAALPERFRRWLEEVTPLLLNAERQAFLRLSTDYQRDAFIDQFWRVRDPYPETAANELKVRYVQRVAQAQVEFGTLFDDRVRMYLVHGLPATKVIVRCSSLYTPAEIWLYNGSEQVSFSVLLIFLVPRDQPARLWTPDIADSELAIQRSRNCTGGDQLELAASQMRAEGLDWNLRFNRMLAKPRPQTMEWLATFQALTTEVPDGAADFPAEVDFDFLGRLQQRTVVQGIVSVPPAEVTVGDSLGFRSYDFELNGEVVRGGKLFENFRYKFSFPEVAFEEGLIPLAFQRYLRPGSYRLILRLEDVHGDRFFRHEAELEVPSLDEAWTPLEGEESITSRLFAEASAAVARGDHSIRILPPRETLNTGFVRFDTLAVGAEIDRVAFLLDDKRRMTKTRPPYTVEIDLGEFPRPHTLRVEALDEAEQVLAWDELMVNAGRRQFRVQLVEPRRGGSYTGSVLARARVDVPAEHSLDRVEFFVNERQVATLYQPPWAQPVRLSPDEELAYVRAVAYLPDGTSVEDLVFVNAPELLEELDVQVVELYTSVLDPVGRPVPGLGREAFTVFEDRERQEIVKFEAVGNQPIHVGILFDNSASMAPLLDAARVAALRFFREAIGPRDRAAVITFNRVPHLAQGLTSDLRLLGGGLAGLSAEGETALYDSVMFGLYYFAGIRGQRALLLLSDGKDEASRFTFEKTLDYARRAGVALYSIGLGLRDPAARSRLQRLAEETGGRAFFIDDLARLTEIYGGIQEELRSQYLLTYQSTNTGNDEEFRAIEVRLDDRSLTAHTLSGYYP